jgi:inorganic pyrophosphatase
VPDLISLSNELDSKGERAGPLSRRRRAFATSSRTTRTPLSSKLGGLLPEGMLFPFDFGFIPSTLGEDGDPVDILVLMDAPAHVGCLVDVRIIGIIATEQIERGKKEKNDRLLGVAVHSYQHEDIKSIKQVSGTLLSQVEEFFISYNRQRGKTFTITAIGGPKKAMKLLKIGIRAHQRKVAA